MNSMDIRRGYTSKKLDYRYIYFIYNDPSTTEELIRFHNLIEEFERSVDWNQEFEVMRY